MNIIAKGNEMNAKKRKLCCEYVNIINMEQSIEMNRWM